MRISDWSSDVCSSDLLTQRGCPFLYIGPTIVGNERSAQMAYRPRRSRQLLHRACGLPLCPRLSSAQSHPRVDCLSKPENGAIAASSCLLQRNARQKRSEEHTSELQALMRITYAVFCLKKKKKK